MPTQNESLCSMEVGSGQLAELLGLTDRRIRQLAAEEILTTYKRGKYYLGDSVQAYIKYIRSGEGSLRGNPTVISPESSYNEEKTKLTSVQRQQAELKLKVAQGELHKSGDIKALVGGMIATTRSRMLDIPNKIGPKIVGKKDLDEINSIIEAEIYLALQSLADYDSAVYATRATAELKVGDDVDDE